MKQRICQGCGLRPPNDRLRPTTCADGKRRWLCEDCALDEHARVRELQRQVIESSDGRF